MYLCPTGKSHAIYLLKKPWSTYQNWYKKEDKKNQEK